MTSENSGVGVRKCKNSTTERTTGTDGFESTMARTRLVFGFCLFYFLSRHPLCGVPDSNLEGDGEELNTKCIMTDNLTKSNVLSVWHITM